MDPGGDEGGSLVGFRVGILWNSLVGPRGNCWVGLVGSLVRVCVILVSSSDVQMCFGWQFSLVRRWGLNEEKINERAVANHKKASQWLSEVLSTLLSSVQHITKTSLDHLRRSRAAVSLIPTTIRASLAFFSLVLALSAIWC